MHSNKTLIKLIIWKPRSPFFFSEDTVFIMIKKVFEISIQMATFLRTFCWHQVPISLPSPWLSAIWHLGMPPHNPPARGLQPASSCMHNDAPCVLCIRIGSQGSCGELIGVTSHSIFRFGFKS